MIGNIESVEEKLAELCGESNMNIINNVLQEETEVLNSNKIWKLKKKLCPKMSEPPSAKVNKQGKLVTNEADIKELYTQTFVDRFKPREIKSGKEELIHLKEKLFEQRRKIAKHNFILIIWQ